MQWRQYEVVGEELPELNHHLAHNNDSVSQMVMQFRQFPSMVGWMLSVFLWTETYTHRQSDQRGGVIFTELICEVNT